MSVPLAVLAVVGTVLGVAACVGIEGDTLGTRFGGKDFPIENLRAVEPGKTTKDEVLRLLGRPQTVRHMTLAKDLAGGALAEPKAVEVLAYQYWEGGQHGVNGTEPHKSAFVRLVDGVVIAYSSSSSFKRGSTDFDLDRAFAITKGSRAEDIVAALGPPSGRGVYPIAGTAAGTSMSYEFAAPCALCESRQKLFTVVLDAEGRAAQVDASLWAIGGFRKPRRLR